MRLVLAFCLAVLMGLPLAAQAEEPTPGRMILVLDASGSMKEKTPDGTPRIDAAKKALRTVIGELPEEQDVGLRVYGAQVFSAKDEGACTDSQLVVEPGTDNRDSLTDAVARYKPYGETPIGYALQQAGKDLGDEGQRTIILVSDGEPTCDPDPCTVAANLAKDGINVRIDVVGLDVSGNARSKLKCIADKGQGTYYDAKNADQLADALDTTATRASRPFDFTGQPVEGTPQEDGAPEISPGLWLDTFPAERAARWYRIERSAPGTSLHVGLQHRSTRTGNFGETASVKIYAGTDGHECGHAMSFPRGSLGFSGAVAWPEGPDSECATATTWLVRVQPVLNAERLAGTPLELAVYEEPPRAADPDLAGSNEPQPPKWVPLTPRDPSKEIVPGGSISNAPLVQDGTYGFDINPGETQSVAVPLDWGQDLQVQFDAELAAESAGQTEVPQLQVLGPLRGEVGGDYTDTTLSDDWTTHNELRSEAGPNHYRWGRQAYAVAWENRAQSEDWWLGSAIPGRRTVVVSLPEDAPNPVEYTLTIKTNGEPGEAPDYQKVDGLTPPTADSPLVSAAGTVTGGDADSSEKKSSTPDGGGFPWLFAGLVAVLLAGLGAAGWVLSRRKA